MPTGYGPVPPKVHWSVKTSTAPFSVLTPARPIIRMLHKLTLSYGPTELLYRPIEASQSGLPAGDSRHSSRQSYAELRGGTPGSRLPRRPASIYTGHPTGRREAFFKGLSCVAYTVVYLQLKVSFTGFSLGKLREKKIDSRCLRSVNMLHAVLWHVMCSFLCRCYVRAVTRPIREIFLIG